MGFPAKFPGTCSLCTGKIEVGESVDWDRAARKVWHARCEPGAASAAHSTGSAALAPVLAPTADAALRLPAPEGLFYLPFQRAGIAYALTRFRAEAQKGGPDPSRGNGVLIADEMG